MSSQRSVTVIGAGIVGTTVATHLQRADFQVTLLDSGGIGQGCSWGNAGGISPGAIVPAATPSLLSSIPRWLLDTNGPLSMRWGYLPRALPWLLKWVAQGTQERRRHNAAALACLNHDPYSGYRALLTPAQYSDLIRVSGQLLVWRADSPADNLAREVREQAGIEMRALDAETLAELEPGLSSDYRRGVLFPGNGFTVNPERLVRTIAQNFQADGGQVVCARVIDFDCGPQGPRALHTDRGTLPVERVVLAAGAWSAQLAKKLGVTVPMEAERGYHLTVEGASARLERPVLDAEQRFMVTPMDIGLRIAGTVEFAGLNAPPDYRRADLLLGQARRMLKEFPEGAASRWMGMRPSMPDSIPVIDRHADFPNVFFAFGHGHLGLSGAPTTGRVITDLVAHRRSSIDLSPFRYGRFGR